ncbi:ankyrin repeat-containing domain protein [Ampelomyces quisqualis]|uniref:Ankyrin repeat-containing domain protein n=1 Tax=Ampelomyces quisqualis TaxID=50730 RepID=A0A6A5QC09_AMPQU|nr:ankyrin repeat-containing domain protein [Ampelomyces quisqualis]
MSDDDRISDLWEDALDRYEKVAPKRSRRDQNLLMTLKTPESLEAYLEKHESSFRLFRTKHGKLTKRLMTCIKPFMTLSDMISAAVSASPFAPASTVVGAVCFVLKAAEGVSEVYDWIEELFDKLRDFTVRLDKYAQGVFPEGFRDKVVEIFGCILEVLACAEKAIKDGRWKKYAAVLFLGGDERVKAAFDELAGLFQSEQALVIAISYATNQKMDKRIEEIGATSEAILKATKTVQEQTNRDKCLEWISKSDVSAQQSDNLGRKQTNTGNWFLQNATFNEWVSGSDQAWGLACPGAPGAGKTTMAATLIHHLSTLGSSDQIGVTYAYANYRSRSIQTLYNLVTALLRCLVQIRSSIPQSVLDTYIKLHKSRNLTLQESVDLVIAVCKEFSMVYIVIDALDECQDGVARDLLRHIWRVHEQTKIRLLVTTRYITSISDMITQELGVVPQLEIRASDDDIREYFSTRASGFQNFLKNNQDLRMLASEKVIEASGGMFLLARLHIDQLSAMVVPAQVKKALSTMFRITDDMSQTAEAYNEQYDQALERIMNQPAYQADLARQTLAWLTFAQRPLKPAELCTALAVLLSDKKDCVDADCIPEMSLVVSICAGLVVVDEQANIVRSVHYTTQEYFERNHQKWLTQGQKQVASTCLAYLSLDTFKNEVQDFEEYYFRLRDDTFYSYAAEAWAKHAKPVEAQLVEEIIGLLVNFSSMRSVSINTTARWQSADPVGYWLKYDQVDPVRIIARAGLSLSLRKYWSDGHQSRKNRPRLSALAQAAGENDVEAVRFLLEQTVDGSFHNGSEEALVFAASGGHTEIVRLILDFWDVADQPQSSPATTKKSRSDDQVSTVVADHTVTIRRPVSTKDAKNQALDHALAEGYESITQILLQRGAVIRHFPFEPFPRRNFDDLMEKSLRIVLSQGYHIDSLDRNGQTALQVAAERNSKSLVSLLIEEGADKSLAAKQLGHYLVNTVKSSERNCERDTVNMLLGYGVDVNAQGPHGNTALIAAISRHGYDYFEVVVDLLNQGARVDMDYGCSEGNALNVAARLVRIKACEILLEHGADINARSGYARCTAFESACKRGHVKVAKLLLDKDAEIPESGVSISGRDITSWWLDEGHLLLQLLHERGIKTNLEGDEAHEPAIYEAVRRGMSLTLEQLLKLGANINSIAGEHGNVLHTALVGDAHGPSGNHVQCVNMLLDHGADLNAPGKVHATTLGAALSCWRQNTHMNRLSEVDTTVPLLERKVRFDGHGPALLEESVTSQALHVARYLLQSGVTIASCPASSNLLVEACRASKPVDFLKLLYDFGADMNLLGPAALHKAAYSAKSDAVVWLLDHDVDANAPGDEYPTALVSAVSGYARWLVRGPDSATIAEKLVEHGAEVKVHGLAALKLIRSNRFAAYDTVVRLLAGSIKDF